MANLRYSDKHNMVAFLKKPTESVGFTKIVDFLKGTSLRYALTHNPTIYDSLVKQFWQSATVRTLVNGIQELVASIDNKEYTITKASIRSQLQLADATGITNLPDAEIYEGLATLGYVSEGKLTFWKKKFTPQWKFIIHNILHCISPKSGGWDQFGSTLATALICLSSNMVYNFLKLIFDGMVHNIESNTKFLMYQRFLQMILGITTENNGKYLAPTLTKKLFANMKRRYAGDYVPLLPAMLAGAIEDQGEGSTIPAEPQHTPTDPVSSTSQPIISIYNDKPLPEHHLLGQLDRHDTEISSSLGFHEAPLHEGHTSGSAEDSLIAHKIVKALQEEEAADKLFGCFASKGFQERRIIRNNKRKEKLKFKNLKGLNLKSCVKSMKTLLPMETDERVKEDRKKKLRDESEEEREAFMKDKVTSASSESEIGIDAIPTATKPPSIVDWKIIPQSGLKDVYQIIRRDGSDKICEKKYGINRPERLYNQVLWGDLKTMFDPPLSDDAIWSLPLQQKMIN
ncbi:hypothetical protein Tco_1044059 [Tanacetum coccineum]|uniref:Synaptobrevin, longin-like domain protein n=1 Tax=Tanacetum coccineum TaxID=301880 RepID=A0ABQ5GPE2_9ASTR